MPTEQKWQLAEGITLLVATPWLLFPNTVPVLTVFSLLALFFSWIVIGWKTDRLFPHTPLNVSLLLWSIMLLIGTLVSADLDLTLPKVIGLLLGLATLRYLVLFVKTADRQRTALRMFILLGAGLLGLGIVSVNWQVKVPALAGIQALLPALLLQLPDTAAEGAHANQLAGALLLFVPVAAAASRGQTVTTLERYATFVLALAAVALLLLSQSRAGWIGGIGGGVAFVGLHLWQRTRTTAGRQRLILLGAGLLLTGMLLLSWTNVSFWEALQVEPEITTAVGPINTIDFRLDVWRWSVTAAKDFVFTGVGLGTFRRVAPRLYPLNIAPGYDIAHAHNIFLQVALDVGLPGLIAYLALLIGAARQLWRAAANPLQRPLANGLLVALIAFHIYGLGDALAPGAKPALLFWYILGLSLTFEHRDQNAP